MADSPKVEQPPPGTAGVRGPQRGSPVGVLDSPAFVECHFVRVDGLNRYFHTNAAAALGIPA